MMLMRIANSDGICRIYTTVHRDESRSAIQQFQQSYGNSPISVSSINPNGQTPETIEEFLFPTRQNRNQPRGKQQ